MAEVNLYTINELAQMFEVNAEDIKKLYKKKVITPSKWGSAGVPHLFDAEHVQKELGIKIRQAPAQDKETGAAVVAESFQSAKARKMAAEATAAELKMMQEQEKAIDPSLVSKMVDDEYVRLRTRLRAIPDKIALELEAATTARQLRRIVAGAIDEALKELSGGAPIVARVLAEANSEETADEFPEDADPSEGSDG